MNHNRKNSRSIGRRMRRDREGITKPSNAKPLLNFGNTLMNKINKSEGEKEMKP